MSYLTAMKGLFQGTGNAGSLTAAQLPLQTTGMGVVYPSTATRIGHHPLSNQAPAPVPNNWYMLWQDALASTPGSCLLEQMWNLKKLLPEEPDGSIISGCQHGSIPHVPETVTKLLKLKENGGKFLAQVELARMKINSDIKKNELEASLEAAEAGLETAIANVNGASK